MRFILLTLALFASLAAGLAATPARADTFEDLVAKLPDGKYKQRGEVIEAIAATGDARAVQILEFLGAGELYQMKADGVIVRVVKEGRDSIAYDIYTAEKIGEVGRRDATKIKVNNSLRRLIRDSVGALTLRAPDPALRLAAAETILKNPDPGQIEALDAAIAAETDAEVKQAFTEARAAAVLASDAAAKEKIAAIRIVAERGDAEALAVITPLASAEEASVASAAKDAIASIESARAVWDQAQNVWYGISLGSVLMLAAIGLAISFGVMGVINMAHGELVMLGAYTTFVVQEVIRNHAPGLFDWSLLIAAPLAFLVAGAVGVAIERGVCRWLYGRALETLLATWGVSLILQQTVRSLFGPTNQEVGNPSWMSGSFEVGQLAVTWNRLWIIVFALVVFGVLLAILKQTPAGLQMRAVTQNRRMADAMGVKTGWVDALTFGLGAGVGGLAGVALSQIDNVSPNLGQGYIVDSFMVVVFGGVGNLWGAFAGAFSLGVLNKFLEPYAGAVLAKILILVFIILFIQKRPRGLFALKGRAVEQ